MPDLRILHQMFEDTVTVSPETGGTKVILSEPACPSSKASIIGLPKDVIIIKADSMHCDRVFRGSNGECKRADYIIVANTGRKKVILFIEMKSRKGVHKEIVQQLLGAQCFFSYFKEIGKVFWGEKTFLDGFTQRFISLKNTSLSKRKTHVDRDRGCHDSPESMMKIDCPHNLQFNMLAGG